MNRKEQIQELEQLLQTRKRQIRAALARDIETESPAGLDDSIDMAQATEQMEMQSELAAVGAMRMVEVQEALNKIKDGTYGQCDDCGEPIALGRLQALPHASKCLDCQVTAERQ